MKKRSERRKHCALAVARRSQKFCHAADAFPGAQDGQNLISWRRSLPLSINPVWWKSTHGISSYRGNRPTHKQTHKHTHKQDRLQYTAPLSLEFSLGSLELQLYPRITQICVQHQHITCTYRDTFQCPAFPLWGSRTWTCPHWHVQGNSGAPEQFWLDDLFLVTTKSDDIWMKMIIEPRLSGW